MTTPYPYQTIGVKKIHRFGGRALLADEMGLGKSLQALLYRKKHLPNKKVIVICPASLKWNWQNEIRKHLNKASSVLEKMKPNPLERKTLTTSKFFIINYEILGNAKDPKSWANWLRKQKCDLLIIDECHNIKNPETKKSKNTKLLSKKLPDIIAISGTPITNRPTELWSTLNILHPDLFPSFRQFASRYSNPEWTPWGIKYKGARRLKELHKVLTKICMIRRLKKDVLKDLPSKTRTVVPIHLPAKAMAEYKSAQDDFRVWLAKRHPKKARKKFKAERLVRMGYLKRLAATLKFQILKEWIDDFLEESSGKLIVFGVHKTIIQGLQKLYGDVSTRIDGSIVGRKRQEAIDAFNGNKRIRIMFGNIKAAGVGWNGVKASTVMFAELDWVPALHVQAEDRAHRIGQLKNVQVYYLVAVDTIEHYLMEIIQGKQKIIDSALDGGEQDDSLDIFDQLSEYLAENR